MRKFFIILGKLSAVLCTILFVVTAVAALVLFNLERKVFNAQTYKQALANQNFYERMPAVIAGALATSQSLNTCEYNMIACGAGDRTPEANACFEEALGAGTYQEIASNKRNPTEDEMQRADACLQHYGLDEPSPGQGAPSYMSNLSAGDWEFIISSLLPPEDLKSLTDEAFDSVVGFLNGKTDSAAISLSPLKTSLGSETGVELVLKMMEAQPDCTDEQLVEIGLAVMSEGKLVMCKPPDAVTDVIKPFIRTQLASTVAGIPDEVTLIPTPTSPENDPRGGLTTVRVAMRLSLLIPLAFLLGLTLFAVRSLNEWLNWWGVPFLIAGLLAGLAGLIGASIIGPFVQNRILSKMPAGMPAIVVESGSDLVTALARQMIQPIIWQGFLLSVLGLGMILFAYFYSRKKNLKTVEPSEADTPV